MAPSPDPEASIDHAFASDVLYKTSGHSQLPVKVEQDTSKSFSPSSSPFMRLRSGRETNIAHQQAVPSARLTRSSTSATQHITRRNAIATSSERSGPGMSSSSSKALEQGYHAGAEGSSSKAAKQERKGDSKKEHISDSTKKSKDVEVHHAATKEEGGKKSSTKGKEKDTMKLLDDRIQ